MKVEQDILLRIKNSVKEAEPDAIVILYGSFARGENRPEIWIC
jgi:predicted nucleotidyltransferase